MSESFCNVLLTSTKASFTNCSRNYVKWSSSLAEVFKWNKNGLCLLDFICHYTVCLFAHSIVLQMRHYYVENKSRPWSFLYSVINLFITILSLTMWKVSFNCHGIFFCSMRQILDLIPDDYWWNVFTLAAELRNTEYIAFDNNNWMAAFTTWSFSNE